MNIKFFKISIAILFVIATIFFLSSYKTSKKMYIEKKTPYDIATKIDFSYKKKFLPKTGIKSALTSYKKINGEEILIVLDRTLGELEVFNLKKDTSLFQINIQEKLNPQEENLMPSIKSTIYDIYLHNMDSIFFTTEHNLYLINSDGIVISKMEINKDKGYTHTSPELTFPMEYDSEKQNVYINHINIIHIRHTNMYYETPIEASINLKTKQVDLLPVKTTQLYREEGYYSGREYPARSKMDTSHIYSYVYDTNIYKYDLESKQYTVYGGRSKYQENPIPPLDKDVSYQSNSNKDFRYWVQQPFYSRVFFDPYKGLFYRLFFKGLPLKNSEGLYTALGDKEAFLMVFNKELSLIKEIPLNKTKADILEFQSFITPDGFYLGIHPHSKEFKKDSIGFHIYNFSIEAT